MGDNLIADSTLAMAAVSERFKSRKTVDY